MKILELLARVGLNTSPFKAGMKEIKKVSNDTAADIAKSFKSALAGYVGYQAFNALITRVAGRAVEIKQLSEQFDATTDEVQKLDRVARGAGKSFEDFGTMLVRMGNARKSAAEDNRDLREQFLKYGVTLEDLQNPQLRNIDLMTKMSRALHGMKLTEQDRENFREIFGKSAPKMLEVLAKFDDSKPINLIEEVQIDRIYKASRELANLKKQYDITASPIVGRGAGLLSSILYGLSFPFDRDQQNMEAQAEKIRNNSPNAHARELAGRFRTFSGTAEDTRRLFDTMMAFHEGGDLRGIKEAGSTNLDEREVQLYKDKLAVADKNDANRAELALQQAILATEVKRGGESAKRAQLQKEMNYYLDQAASMEKELAKDIESGQLDQVDIDRQFIAEMRTEAEKAKQELMDKSGTGRIGVDELQRRGQLTGGTLGRIGFYDSIGVSAAAIGGDIPKQQLMEARAQTKKLDQIEKALETGSF